MNWVGVGKSLQSLGGEGGGTGSLPPRGAGAAGEVADASAETEGEKEVFSEKARHIVITGCSISSWTLYWLN